MSRLFCGIVGLPNVGKSTIFNALTQANAPSSNYPFCTIDPHVGVVSVYDPRIDALASLSKSRAKIYATMEFVDIAGLVKGASQGEGLGNQFLSHIRETDAILHIVRCFEDPDIIHVGGKVDPIADVETINLELKLADLQMVENVIVKTEKQAKTKKEMQELLDVLKKVAKHLDGGHPVRTLALSEEEARILKPYPFLTQKKILYVANVSEHDLPAMDNAFVQQLSSYAKEEGNEVIAISGKIESELSELQESEKKELLKSLGLEETGLNRLIKKSFSMLGLITFLTTGEMESRAWTIPRGTSAYEAAGKIHTDIQKRFAKAEVVSYEDFIKYQGRVLAKEAGKLRIEGRSYIVQDGDIIVFL